MTSQDLFEVAIIGGGVAGLAIFQELKRTGMRVILLEAGQLFQGASGNSLRIMHSGLRYLKSGRFDLYLESRKAQRVIREGFSGLVSAKPFVVEGPPLLGRFFNSEISSPTFLPISNPLSWSEWLLNSPHGLSDQLAQHAAQGEIVTGAVVAQIARSQGVFQVDYREVPLGGVKHSIFAKSVINCAGSGVNKIALASYIANERILGARPKFVRAWNILTNVNYDGPIFARKGSQRMVVGTPRDGRLVIGTGYGESTDGTFYVTHGERCELLRDFGLNISSLIEVEGGMLAVANAEGIKFLGRDLVTTSGNYAEVFAAKFVTFPILAKRVRSWLAEQS